MKCWAKLLGPNISPYKQNMSHKRRPSLAQQIWSNIIGVARRNISGTYIPGGKWKLLLFFSEISTTTPNTIHQRSNTSLQCNLILLGLAGNDRFEQTWEASHCTTTSYLASTFHQGCQISRMTKFKKGGKFSCARAVLHKHVMKL